MVGSGVIDLLRRGVVALERIATALEASREDWHCDGWAPGTLIERVVGRLDDIESEIRESGGRA